MDKFFIYENYEIKLNTPNLLMIKEFERLMDKEFNKCEEDKTGERRLKAFKVFKYLYLIDDIDSPYREKTEDEKREYALFDCDMKIHDLENPVIQEAVKKYFILTNTRLSKLLKAAERSIDELTLHFDTVDYTTINDVTEKPNFAAKDGISNVSNLDKVVDNLKKLQIRVDEERKSESAMRGGVEKGMFD